jgi:multicomponent Na+:H+ antiporter subunit G
MDLSNFASFVLIVVGSVFFFGGTVGVLRFPDVYSRLHALGKADNVGLGFIAAGVAIHAPAWTTAATVVLVWWLAVLAGGTATHLVARAARRSGIEPRTKR